MEEEKHTVSLDEDGGIIVEFAKPLSAERHGMSVVTYFGNVRGVQIIVGRKGRKEQIAGFRFDDFETMKRFHAVNNLPKFDELLAIVESLIKEQKAK